MHYKKIELCTKENKTVNQSEVQELLRHFLFVLNCNGQILSDYKVILQNNYVLYVTTPKQDSLSEKYDSPYVKKARKKITELFAVCVEDCGIDTQSQSYCNCKNRSAIEMQTAEYDTDSVFICCDCGKPVALYELPLLKDSEDYCRIQMWQHNYADTDRLWMNGLFDRFTGNQRVNFDSALNKLGRKIADEMSENLGCPVYYHLASDYGKKVKLQEVGNEKLHVCPKCGKVMKRMEISEKYKIDVCAECRLSYDVDKD